MKAMTEEDWKQLNILQKSGYLIFGLGMLAAMVAFVVVMGAVIWGAATTDQAPATSAEAKAEPAQPVEPAARPKRQPLDLTDARRLAQLTLQTTERAAESLIDAIRLQDRHGKYSLVDKPLNDILGRWPTLIDDRDATAHFSNCGFAGRMLQSMSASALQTQSTATMRSMRDHGAEFDRAIDKCRAELALSDAEIMRRVAAEDAELKRRIGGRECLTTYDLDPKTGELITLPKPAHCPK